MERTTKRESMEEFIRIFQSSNVLLTEFDEELWNAIIEKVVINSDHEINFAFKDGIEMNWNI